MQVRLRILVKNPTQKATSWEAPSLRRQIVVLMLQLLLLPCLSKAGKIVQTQAAKRTSNLLLLLLLLQVRLTPWPSSNLSASSSNPSPAVAPSNSFVFTHMSASDRELAPVQESDYEDIDSGRKESKPASIKRSDEQGDCISDSVPAPSRGASPSPA